MKSNWKTSLAGVMMLALTGFQVYANPQIAKSQEGQAAIVTGVLTAVGLITASDAKKDPRKDGDGKPQS